MKITLQILAFAMLCSSAALAQEQTNPPAAPPPQAATSPDQSPPAAPAPPPNPPQAADKAPASTPATEPPATDAPHKYVELWNTGNFDRLDTIFEPPMVMVSHGNRAMLHPDLLKKVITAWRKSMPDLNFKVEDSIVQGDKVALRLSLTGTYKERLWGGTATPGPDIPRTVRATEMLMFLLKDGKIKEIWEEYDEIRMRLQMGGSWHSNEELDGAAAAAAAASKPAPTATPESAPPPKP